MKISIITAVYNRAGTLSSSIDSVQSQCYANTKHVLVDSASSDGSVELIQQRLRPSDLFVSERDGGIYGALNKGLKIATGDIIGLRIAADYDAMLRYPHKGQIQLAYIPGVLVKMRVGGFGTLLFKNLSKVKQFF